LLSGSGAPLFTAFMLINVSRWCGMYRTTKFTLARLPPSGFPACLGANQAITGQEELIELIDGHSG
jgi:hypothetical protein